MTWGHGDKHGKNTGDGLWSHWNTQWVKWPLLWSFEDDLEKANKESNNDKWANKQAHEDMAFWELEVSKGMFIHSLKLTYWRDIEALTCWAQEKAQPKALTLYAWVTNDMAAPTDSLIPNVKSAQEQSKQTYVKVGQLFFTLQ